MNSLKQQTIEILAQAKRIRQIREEMILVGVRGLHDYAAELFASNERERRKKERAERRKVKF